MVAFSLRTLVFPLLALVAAALLMSALAPSAASAQSVGQTEGMRHFSDLEEALLQERQALLNRERDVQSPIWVTDELGEPHIIDGEALRTRVAGLASFAELVIAERLSAETFGLADALMAQLAAGKVAAADPVGRIMAAYEEQSTRNRARALQAIDSRLEFVRAQFEQELAARDVQESEIGGAHPCQQTQSLDARRFFFRHFGNSDWRLFVQNGGFYCAAPISVASFRDSQYYAYVTISGEYLTYTECPGGACVTSSQIWKATVQNEGDRHMEGAVYRDSAQETSGGSLASFNWWQCSPATPGSNPNSMCLDSLVLP